MKFAEDFQMPSVTELSNLETWVNVHPSILKAGRCTHLELPEGMDEEEKQKILRKLKNLKITKLFKAIVIYNFFC